MCFVAVSLVLLAVAGLSGPVLNNTDDARAHLVRVRV